MTRNRVSSLELKNRHNGRIWPRLRSLIVWSSRLFSSLDSATGLDLCPAADNVPDHIVTNQRDIMSGIKMRLVNQVPLSLNQYVDSS